ELLPGRPGRERGRQAGGRGPGQGPLSPAREAPAAGAGPDWRADPTGHAEPPHTPARPVVLAATPAPGGGDRACEFARASALGVAPAARSGSNQVPIAAPGRAHGQ